MSSPVTILVVDDDALDRTAVRRALRSSDLAPRILEAEDGAQAMEILAQSSCDVILLDYRLPGTDGLEILRTMRASGVKYPVIVMTGQGDEQLAVEIMKAGATDYLAKGKLSSDTLAGSIRYALRMFSAEQQTAAAEAQRLQAEAALRQNERMLAITLKSIGDAVIATDAGGNITFINAVGESLTGWSAADALGQPLSLVLPLDRPLIKGDAPLDAATSTGPANIVAEARVQTSDGRSFPVVVSYAPIRGDDGAVVGAVAVVRDITERVRTENHLHFLAEMSQLSISSFNYQERLTKLAQLAAPRLGDFCAIDVQAPDGTIERLAFSMSDRLEGVLDTASPSYATDPAETYGQAQVIRAGRTEYYPEVSPELLASIKPIQRAAVEVAGLVSWVIVPLNVRGQTVGAISFARTRSQPRYTPDDVVFCEEVARRAALAVDNALLYREAQDAIKTRDAFLSIAAHELKTPLTTMQGSAELLERRTKRSKALEERDQRLLGVVIDQAKRLNKMVMALFDLSRLQLGQLSIERELVDVGALTERIVKEVEPTLDRHTILLEHDDAPALVLGDELRLEQVLHNLIQNAIKYSPEGGLINVRIAHNAGGVELSVQDRGLGIPRDSLQGIFHRFYRAANAEPHQISGMGVGLYVAKQIVDLHGGHVAVDSTEGVGSTFMIWLPAEASPAAVAA